MAQWGGAGERPMNDIAPGHEALLFSGLPLCEQGHVRLDKPYGRCHCSSWS
jgi:hypothetical protein